MTEMNETHATIRADVSDVRNMIEKTSLTGDAEHVELYMNVLDGKVEFLKANGSESVVSYSTFDESYFKELSVEKEIETLDKEHSGVGYEYDVGAEAIIEVERTLEYLNYAVDGGIVEMTLMGDPDRRLSTMLQMEGSLNTWVNLPGSSSILENVPFWVTSRYDDDEVMVSPTGSQAPARIQAVTSELSTIVDVVDGNPESEYYPVVVEDGSLQINVGSRRGMGVRGTLSAGDVQGPDFENNYFEGFSEVISTLSGTVNLYTAPDNNPLSFVWQDDSSVVRHMCGPVSV